MQNLKIEIARLSILTSLIVTAACGLQNTEGTLVVDDGAGSDAQALREACSVRLPEIQNYALEGLAKLPADAEISTIGDNRVRGFLADSKAVIASAATDTNFTDADAALFISSLEQQAFAANDVVAGEPVEGPMQSDNYGAVDSCPKMCMDEWEACESPCPDSWPCTCCIGCRITYLACVADCLLP